ncbi:interferon-induced protein with tetratricopeptide repeats 1-like [Dromiciops gliroides]|uniref:interferon-induced protein with tetratricopeptide repeats 1-like n=1 Tax=Dromiciops gliroides TaxID=33562 RepID=UPI001CC580F8|nr:interferon-induced protein with tetratricopeptide repeats 1-like [Dromiciops gliroides]
MSEMFEGSPSRDVLLQLRCHFTWDLSRGDLDLPDLENRIVQEIEFLDTKFNVGIHSTLAYVKHLKRQNEEALESLRKAEELIQRDHTEQAEIQSLVAWGNYAWIYYHMGRLPEAQTYLDKVEASCKKLSSPSRYSVELPEIDCEEGWALLKFGGRYYERAKVCFQKALQLKPDNPAFVTGFAIAVYRLDEFFRGDPRSVSLEPLRQAVMLHPEDTYIKALLALKLQDQNQEEEGERYMQEALSAMSSRPYVLRYAAKFYRIKGSLEKALQFLKSALQITPLSAVLHHQMALCYRDQMLLIKRTTINQFQGRQRFGRMIKSALFHFKKAVEYKPGFVLAYIGLANMYAEAGDYVNAEENFQRILHMEQLEDVRKQEIHFHYGRFQELHRRSETNALTHYLEGLKVKKETYVRQLLLVAVEKLVVRQLRRNRDNVENLFLPDFVHEESEKSKNCEAQR